MIAKPKKYVGRIAKPPALTKIEVLTRGLMREPDEVKSNFSIKEDEKGRGVYLRIPELPKGSFVLEYEGDIITPEEVEQREKIYAFNGEGCFIMEFRFKGSKMAIDATRNFDSYTRLLNHSRHPNIKFHSPIVVDFSVSPRPRIAAYALRDIKRGEEIVFDYGVKDRSIPWLKNRKIGFAEVSEDEYDEEDDDSKDNESITSSDGNYLCLRYTAARVGRLDGDVKPPFNYRELSKSASSSSDTSQSSQHHRTKKKKKLCPKVSASQQEKMANSDDQSTSTNAEVLGLDNPSHPMGSVECKWKFMCLNNGYFITIDNIPPPQKILKCLEPKGKSRKRENSGSTICLSDESSPSQESVYSNPYQPSMIMVPEVSIEKKVVDWQNNLCFEENNLSIKIVGVQSLSDSHEHMSTSEPPYPMDNHINSHIPLPLVSSERLQDNSCLPTSLPSLELVPPNLANSTTSVEASPALHQLPLSSLETQQSLFQPLSSNHLPPPSTPMQQTHKTTQGISLEDEHLVSQASVKASPQTSVHPDLSYSTGSNNMVLSKPAQKPDSPVTISDSEDQPFAPMPSSQKPLRSSNFSSVSEMPTETVYFSPKKTNPLTNEKVCAVVKFNDKASTSQNVHHSPQQKLPRKLVQHRENCIAQSQDNHVQKQSQIKMLPNHDSNNLVHMKPLSHHGQTENQIHTPFSQPLMQQQNCMPQPSQRRMLPQLSECRSLSNHVPQQQIHSKGTQASIKNVSCENQKPGPSQQKCVNRTSLGKDEYVVIEDDDNVSVARGDCSKKAMTIPFSHNQSKATPNILVLSSSDESDVEEIAPPCRAQMYPSNGHKMRSKTALKLESGGSDFTVNTNSNINIDDSECELVLVEHSSQSASTPRRVAVIQPYTYDSSDSNACQSDNALTNAEMDHLSKIFDRHSFSRNVSKESINEKIHKHWNFFNSILVRGISIQQIRAAVKQMYVDKYGGSI